MLVKLKSNEWVDADMVSSVTSYIDWVTAQHKVYKVRIDLLPGQHLIYQYDDPNVAELFKDEAAAMINEAKSEPQRGRSKANGHSNNVPVRHGHVG